jgi:hypothetical protein
MDALGFLAYPLALGTGVVRLGVYMGVWEIEGGIT